MKEQEIDMKTQVRVTVGSEGSTFHLSGCMCDNIFVSPQLDMYSKKFDEFQGTVSKSNSVYSSFKQDMDKVRIFSQNIWSHGCVIEQMGD